MPWWKTLPSLTGVGWQGKNEPELIHWWVEDAERYRPTPDFALDHTPVRRLTRNARIGN